MALHEASQESAQRSSARSFVRYAIGLGWIALGALAAFCCWYPTQSYEELARWYLSLGDGCIYRQNEWLRIYFTPEVKATGNVVCLIALTAILLCAAGLLWTWRRATHKARQEQLPRTRVDWLAVAGICVVAVALGVWSCRHALPGSDEIFSAVYAADEHPFQALSYYMLPNNHVFYNVLNSLLAAWVEDKVLSARCISVGAYAATLCVAYHWLREVISSRWLALAAVAVLALQSPVWGFAGQGRGYALYVLMHWVAFAALYRYGFDGRRSRLWAYGIASAIGYAIVPTFMYFSAGAAVWASAYQLRKRRFDMAFWMSHGAAVLCAALFHVPLWCFTGLNALWANPYAVPAATPVLEWLSGALPGFADYDNYAFAGRTGPLLGLNTLLLLAPVSLLFLPRTSKARRTGAMVVALWVGMLLVVFAMRKEPPHRNVLGFYSISAAATLILLYQLSIAMASKPRKAWLLPAFFTGVCIFLSARFVQWSTRELPGRLYYTDVNWAYNATVDALQEQPRGSVLHTSNEAFIAHYTWKRQGEKVLGCDDALNADYHARIGAEEGPLPQELGPHFRYVRSEVGIDFYKRIREMDADSLRENRRLK